MNNPNAYKTNYDKVGRNLWDVLLAPLLMAAVTVVALVFLAK